MKLGPNQIVACPRCGTLSHYRALVSGNSIGAEGWTDGRQYGPMMVEPPAVVKCHACATCHWLADAKEVGVVARDPPWKGPVPEEWEKAPEVKEPSADAYFLAIEAGLAKDGAQERSLRLLAWWRANDSAREGRFAAEATPASPEGFRRNLQRLLALLNDDTDNDRLMRAEVLRELGDFAAAKQALREVSTAELGWVADQIRHHCAAKDTRVHALERGRATRT